MYIRGEYNMSMGRLLFAVIVKVEVRQKALLDKRYIDGKPKSKTTNYLRMEYKKQSKRSLRMN